MNRSALSQLILNGYLPFYNAGENGGAGGGEGNVTPPDGKNKGAVIFKDQATFDAVITTRIEQAKRSWESEEKPKIIEDVTKAVKDEIQTEAERKAAEASGEYKKLYDQVTGAEGFDALPKESSLYKLYEGLVKKITEADTAVAALVEDEAKDLSDQMKALMPDGYSPQMKLEWIRTAKKVAGNEKPQGNNHRDPNPSGTQGRTVEDVINELRGTISYGTNRPTSRRGVEGNGGSQ